jgi:quercetin dioxygenase-like cupin family protein
VIIKRARDAERVPRSGPLFVGEHEYRAAVGAESRQFRLGEMTFRDGTRTKLHVHDSEQVILVTAGVGIVATADAEHRIEAGDVAIIPLGEPHWHGSGPGDVVTQWSILGPHKTTLA